MLSQGKMNNFNSKKKNIVYKNKRVVRVVCHFTNNGRTTGTGFLVNKGKNILTCWHVVCGTDLKRVLKSELYSVLPKQPEAKMIDAYYHQLAGKIEAELFDGTKISVKLDSYDYFYDLAVLKVISTKRHLPYFEIETKDTLDYADEISFPGYPANLWYNFGSSPFSVNSGSVSSFPVVEISGGKYRMVQLTGICIGGNSGAPVIKKQSDKAIGILNGYEWRGFDNIAIFKDGSFSKTENLQVPVNISYATEFNFLSKKSRIFKNLLKVIES